MARSALPSRALAERDRLLAEGIREAAREGRPVTWAALAAAAGFSGRSGAREAAKRLGLRKRRVNRAGEIAAPLHLLTTGQRGTYLLARCKGHCAHEAFALARAK